MANFKDKIENREVIFIEDFVLVKSNEDKTFNDKEDRNNKSKAKEKGVYVGASINKDNIMQYDIYTKAGEKIGIADYKTGKILKWSPKYKHEKNINIIELLEKQKQKDLANSKESRINKANNAQRKENDEKKPNKDNQENNKANQIKDNSKNKNTIDEKKDNYFTKEQLKEFNSVRITDFEFTADLINPNEYNIYDVHFINKNGKFEMVAYDRSTGNYKKIDQYMYKSTKVGEMDTIEKNREETEIGYGAETTYIDRFGNKRKIDVKQGATGEIELRDTTKDLDKDGTKEGIKIATERDTRNDKYKNVSRIEEADNVNEVKKEKGIETDEVNDGPLTNEQIKEMIADADLSAKEEAEVLKEVSSRFQVENPNKEQLGEIIENHKGEREDLADDEHDHEPGITYSRGIKMFHGKPIE